MAVPTQTSVHEEGLPVLLIASDAGTRQEVCGYLHTGLRNPTVRCLGSADELHLLPDGQAWSLCLVMDDDRTGYLTVLEQIRSRDPGCPVLLMLEPGNEDRAEQARRRGIDDCIVRTDGYGERLQSAVKELIRASGERSSPGYKDNFRALQTSARQFQELVENAAEGILIHAEDKPVYVNPALVRILGYDRREDVLSLSSICDFVDFRDQQRELKLTRRLQAGIELPGAHVLRARRRDGSLIWLENRINTVTWQGYPAVQCTLVDVSGSRRASNALRLAARVGSRAGEKVDFEAAIRVALRWLARGMGWEVAESWIPSADNEMLEAGPSWCRDRKRFQRFIQGSRQQRFAPRGGPPWNRLEDWPPRVDRKRVQRRHAVQALYPRQCRGAYDCLRDPDHRARPDSGGAVFFHGGPAEARTGNDHRSGRRRRLTGPGAASDSNRAGPPGQHRPDRSADLRESRRHTGGG